MKKSTLLHTNIIILAILTIGFVTASFIGYRSNTAIFERDAEHVSTLSVDGINYQFDKNFYDPMNFSLTMADHSFLKNLLSEEGKHQEDDALKKFKTDILKKQDEQKTFWYSDSGAKVYMVSCYIPSMKWDLIVENHMSALYRKLNRQLYTGIGIIMFIILFAIYIITKVHKHYRTQIIKLNMAHQQDYQKILDQLTEGVYENIFEIDITHNCGGDKMVQYFESIGLPKGTSFDQGLREIAKQQVKEEYVQDYLDLFLPEHMLRSYKDGVSSLKYDFPKIGKNGEYRWSRVTAHIFYLESDETFRAISYCKNIDEEKRRELSLLAKSRQDSLTGLYNKGTTESMICQVLNTAEATVDKHALLMFDIDDFKNVNDQYGHIMGDTVITEFASELRNHFRDMDIVGRVGGDEFAVLMVQFKDYAMLSEKLERFCAQIARKDFGQQKRISISCSIGAAVYPDHGTSFPKLFENADQALYYAKAHGKCSYYILEDGIQDSMAFYVDSKVFKTMLDYATDGVAKFACTSPLKLLYFNQKLMDLLGYSPQELSSGDLNPFACVHPDDLKRVMDTLQEVLPERKSTALIFRIRHRDGHYFSVKLSEVFVHELYENQYPIFYAVYNDLTGFVQDACLLP